MRDDNTSVGPKARLGTHAKEFVERRAHHLHEVECAGESAETPLIAIVGLVLFFACVFVIMAALSFAAYYLAR